MFRYLGCAHRLLLVDDPGDWGVRVVAGRLALDRGAAADPARGRRELIAWYSRAGLGWARGRLQPWAARLDVPDPAVEVRDLGLRWGSYTPGNAQGAGSIALNWAVFQLPMRLVDYVIAHELAHIRIAGHAPTTGGCCAARSRSARCARRNWTTWGAGSGRARWRSDGNSPSGDQGCPARPHRPGGGNSRFSCRTRNAAGAAPPGLRHPGQPVLSRSSA
ncbi:DUF45 domain-containing protein [Streptomyces sp. F63]|nr:DUF45 domain-containing protein [Streptomyces sp. F63]